MLNRRRIELQNLIEVRCEVLMLLFGILMLIGFPVSFLLFFIETRTEDFILHTVGVAFALSLLRYSIYHYQTRLSPAQNIIKIKVALPVIAGLFLLFVIVVNTFSYRPYLTGVFAWALVSTLVDKTLKILKSHTKESSPDLTKKFDEESTINPEYTNADVIYEVENVIYGDKFVELLFNCGITVQLLDSVHQHIRTVIIHKGENWASVRLLNRSFMQTAGSHHLDLSDFWDITVAKYGYSDRLTQDIESTLRSVVCLGEQSEPPPIKKVLVNRIQALKALANFDESIRKPSSQRMLSLKYFDACLEINTLWLDIKAMACSQTLTLSIPFGYLQSENLGINENLTVATRNVPLFEIPLPFEYCKLTEIWILSVGEQQDTVVLNLAFHELIKGELTSSKVFKSIVLRKDDTLYESDSLALCGRYISVADYINRQAVTMLHGDK